MTIYLPDDLHERVKAVPDLNVSAVAQAALERELASRTALEGLSESMERVEAYDESRGGDVAFIGTLLLSDHDVADLLGSGSSDLVVYLTARHQIAIIDRRNDKLEVYEDLEAMADDSWEPAFVALVAKAMGEQRTVFLDI